MTPESRMITESPLYQGVDEQIAYALATTPWGSSPTSPAVILKDRSGTDVSATYLSGTPTVSGNVITTPTVQSLVAGSQYRLEIQFTVSGNVEETWADIIGQE